MRGSMSPDLLAASMAQAKLQILFEMRLLGGGRRRVS